MDQVIRGFRHGLRPMRPTWRLALSDAETVTPLVRRLRFEGRGLGGMEWAPGQDLVLNLPEAPRRHYTIRALRDGLLDIDFVLHGHGPAAWAGEAKAGVEIDAEGPRGRTRVAVDVDWHLFLGDETCIPAIFAMIETLPAGARAFAFLEIETLDERQDVSTAADLKLEWIVRGGPARPNTLLLEQLKAFTPPAGRATPICWAETGRADDEGIS